MEKDIHISHKGQGAATNREKSRASLGQGRALRPVKTGYREQYQKYIHKGRSFSFDDADSRK
jgi:hypothetical protein